MIGRPRDDGSNVGATYMKVSRKKRVIVLEELDFVWDEPDLKELSKMWREQASILEMGERFDRDADEILLALLHLARIDRIHAREGGVLHGLM